MIVDFCERDRRKAFNAHLRSLHLSSRWKTCDGGGCDDDCDGTVERMPLFDDRLQDYYWQHDNQGLRVVQLRFDAQPTNVN